MADDQAIRLAHEAPFRVGGLSVTPATRQVAWADQARTLEPRVMQVLVALAGARGAVVGRDDLIQRCWDGRVVGENAINRVISLLRQLGAETGGFSLETVTKVGYRLLEGVATDRQEAPALRGRRRFRLGALAALVLAAAGLFAGWWIHRAGPPAAQNGRIEVARFEARQDDAELARLSAAVGDSLIQTLTRSGIDTVPDTGARGAQPAAELRVTGAIDRQGRDIVVNAQVLDRRSGLVLSSLQLTRPTMAARGLADQAAFSIAASLTCALEDRKRSRRAMPPTTFSLYLNACDAVAREGNTQRMLETTRRLVAAAPDLAVGHALYGIAQANAAGDMTYGTAEADALRRAARQSAAHALQLDPQTPKAYVAIANSYPAGGDWTERERNFIKAREIDPNLNPGRISYVGLLRETGRLKEALEVTGRVLASGDPRTLAPAKIQAILVNAELGDTARARALLGELEQFDPQAAGGIGWMLASTWEEPDAALARLRALGPHGPYNPRTFACAETFLRELPQRQSRRARGLPGACDGAPGERRVLMLAREGDVDGAYAEVSKALDAPNRSAGFLFYPAMAEFRRDSRFMPLTRRLGLLDYWRRSGHWPDFCADPSLPYDCREATQTVAARRAG